ncbi:hypothetical protein PCANC_03367 [Puccinia coronata f. sp. avenae]|uniref:Uncharacterized protein n=1 Tax=Puccinia coronata f. sp. avenae TaxID=200324 RepID=A0A2N5T8T9_9BASI|nr:hypothetical protein PCANC_03367 [Puccinia coronata f. sp. avenae]
MKQAYNHYVHYSLAKVANKEKKEEGKHFRDEERKVLQTAQERLKDRQYKFAVSHDLPKRYLKMINTVQAHSDNKYYPDKDIYVVKKLPF